MGWVKMVVVGVAVVWAARCMRGLLQEPPPPHMEPNPWWGPGDPLPQEEEEDATVNQFRIAVHQEAVDDLRARLELPARLTPALEDANFTYGFTADTLAAVMQYWRHNYDWRKREDRLNTFPHFKTRIEGLDIHFLRARGEGGGPGVKVVPLLMVHGWPGSFVEFYDILPLLTSPQEGSGVAFEVICPSIPGYGFSQASAKQGFGHLETAQIFLKLMKRLGFEKFFVQGGDWGSLIVTDMATLYPENVLGVHVNMIPVNTLGASLKMLLGSVLPAGVVVDSADQHRLYPLSKTFGMMLRESGYMHIQATKPDTVGAAVNQSPVSMAAYILEKFSTWTHKLNPQLPDGGLLHPHFPISLDKMIDNLCIYWFTGSITSSMRYYAENFSNFGRNLDSIPCRVPAGLANFPQELSSIPKNFAAHKFYDIVTFTDQPAGGHFAAMERPELLAADVHAFVREVLKRN